MHLNFFSSKKGEVGLFSSALQKVHVVEQIKELHCLISAIGHRKEEFNHLIKFSKADTGTVLILAMKEKD